MAGDRYGRSPIGPQRDSHQPLKWVFSVFARWWSTMQFEKRNQVVAGTDLGLGEQRGQNRSR